MLKFIAGLMIGGVLSVVVMCLMFVAKEADRHIGIFAFDVIQRDEARTAEPSVHTRTEPT